MTLEERKQKALEIRKQGYNCAQTVLMVFAADLGLTEGQAGSMTSGLGGGVGACGELCGVPLGMAIAQSMICGPDPTKKARTYGEVRSLMEEFASRHNGFLRCRDLKSKPNTIPCNELILNGIEILHKALTKQ